MPDEVCIKCGCHARAACWIESTTARLSYEGPCLWSEVTRLCSACDPELAVSHRRLKIRRINVFWPKGSNAKHIGALLFHPERKYWRYEPFHRYRPNRPESEGIPDTLTTPISDPSLRRLKRHLGHVAVYRETDRHLRR